MARKMYDMICKEVNNDVESRIGLLYCDTVKQLNKGSSTAHEIFCEMVISSVHDE